MKQACSKDFSMKEECSSPHSQPTTKKKECQLFLKREKQIGLTHEFENDVKISIPI